MLVGRIARGKLTPAHGDDDFNFVAIGQQALCEHAAGNYLAITLDCDAFPGQIQRCKQIGDADLLCECLLSTVDAD
jgi:hypothetical protein